MPNLYEVIATTPFTDVSNYLSCLVNKFQLFNESIELVSDNICITHHASDHSIHPRFIELQLFLNSIQISSKFYISDDTISLKIVSFPESFLYLSVKKWPSVISYRANGQHLVSNLDIKNYKGPYLALDPIWCSKAEENESQAGASPSP